MPESDIWTRIEGEEIAPHLDGRTVASAVFERKPGNDEVLVLTFTDGTRIEVAGAWGNDGSGGLDFFSVPGE